MPAQKSPGTRALSAVLRTLGFTLLAGVLVAVMAIPAAAVVGLTANNSLSIAEGLPDYVKLGQQRQKNEIYVKTPEGQNQLITTVFDQNREEITLDQMSEPLRWAAVAGEDRRFYDHDGVDVASVARAAVGTVLGESGAGGASTLTMQTVRNILVLQAANSDQLSGQERQAAQERALEYSASRKLREMKLAIGLEREYSKDEILAGYLNIANFGNNTYGVQTAAQQYFGVPASEVNVAQAASLLAIVQQPSILNLSDPENWPQNQVRRDFIIGAMLEEGYIDQGVHDEAVAIPVDEAFVLNQPPTQGCLAVPDPAHRSFCDYVEKLVLRGQVPSIGSTPEEAQANWTRGGYQVIGTLDTGVQAKADEQAKTRAPADETRFALGAAVSTVQVGTGRILAMAQNKNFDDSAAGGGPTTTAINYNTDNRYGGSNGFQPGSTYKPFTLLAWLQAGHGVNESVNASKLDYTGTTFEDSCNATQNGSVIRNDEGERGSYTITRGTARSVNAVFMQMASQLDQCAIRDVARALGVHNATGKADGSDLQTLPSCVLGGCENTLAPLTLAAAYAAIANQGVFCRPIAVDLVIGPEGEELPGQDPACTQAIAPEIANAAAFAMKSVVSGGGTAGASNPSDGVEYLGKTGTTDKAVHTWMVGSSTKAATAVWVGNTTGTQSLRDIRVAGSPASVLRHQIFRPLAQYVDERFGGDDFVAPPAALLRGTPTTVPDVSGRSVDEARSVLDEAGLALGATSDEASDLPAGSVIRTEPGAGRSVTKGTAVALVVSTGAAPAPVPEAPDPEQSSAPDVVGQSFEQGQAAFQQSGFTVTERCQALADGGDPAQIGQVVAQDPAAGASAPAGSTATLTVSRARC